MSKAINTQSQKRHAESLASLFEAPIGKPERRILFLKSSSDEGVVQNGGRNGARLAPQSLLASFKRLSLTQDFTSTSFEEIEVASPDEERQELLRAQNLQADRMKSVLGNGALPWVIHIGCGHDHVFPLLLALQSRFKKIVVINIDAHADTRTDVLPNSGTPFRQFARSFHGDFHLFQIGLHPYSNSQSTLTPLERGQTHVLWKHEAASQGEKFYKKIEETIDSATGVIFSLDADALSASIVPGVSAANPDGFDLETLTCLWAFYRRLKITHSPILGIYELNPVYDTVASQSMRALSAFLFKALR